MLGTLFSHVCSKNMKEYNRFSQDDNNSERKKTHSLYIDNFFSKDKIKKK